MAGRGRRGPRQTAAWSGRPVGRRARSLPTAFRGWLTGACAPGKGRSCRPRWRVGLGGGKSTVHIKDAEASCSLFVTACRLSGLTLHTSREQRTTGNSLRGALERPIVARPGGGDGGSGRGSVQGRGRHRSRGAGVDVQGFLTARHLLGGIVFARRGNRLTLGRGDDAGAATAAITTAIMAMEQAAAETAAARPETTTAVAAAAVGRTASAQPACATPRGAAGLAAGRGGRAARRARTSGSAPATTIVMTEQTAAELPAARQETAAVAAAVAAVAAAAAVAVHRDRGDRRCLFVGAWIFRFVAGWRLGTDCLCAHEPCRQNQHVQNFHEVTSVWM
jgi:hypothetical protein